MKPLKKLKLNGTILTTKELNELNGGYTDVINQNEVSGCVCNYKNKTRVINNTNEVLGCNCVCTY